MKRGIINNKFNNKVNLANTAIIKVKKNKCNVSLLLSMKIIEKNKIYEKKEIA